MDTFAGITFLGKATRGVADTHNGARNKPNEDRYITFIGPGDMGPQAQFLVVADGVTSTHGGERASDIAVRVLREALTQPAPGNGRPARPLRERMADAIHRANQAILETARKDPELKGMSTTLVIAAVDGDQLTLMHLGDSRAYLIRDGKAHQLSRDHTWVQEALDEGRITPEQAANHPNKHVILRYLGDTRGLSIDQGIQTPDKLAMDVDRTEVGGQVMRSADTALRLRAGDTLLLCSDGLYNRVTDAEIAAAVTNQPPDKAVSWLINEAVRRQEPDNITVVVWTTAEPKTAVAATLPKSRRTALALAAAGALLAVMALFIFSRGDNPPPAPATEVAVAAGAVVDTLAPPVEAATATDAPASTDATPTVVTEEPAREIQDAPPLDATPTEAPAEEPPTEEAGGETATAEPGEESAAALPAAEQQPATADSASDAATDASSSPAGDGTSGSILQRATSESTSPERAAAATMRAIGTGVAGQPIATPAFAAATATSSATATPTRNQAPTSTPMSTHTPTPSPTPTATRTPTAAPTGTASTTPTTAPNSVANNNHQVGPTSATIEMPSDGAASNMATRFKWTANAPLAPGQGFEVLFWRFDQTEADGRGIFGASTATDVMQPVQVLAPGGYRWALWLVQTEPKYDKIRMLAGPFAFTVSLSGSTGPGNTGAADGK